MFRRILIANRGEVAARVLRTCRRLGIAAVAVATPPDRDLSWLRDADAVVPLQGIRGYLDMDLLIEAATSERCSAVHPGWGFLAENATFAARCESAGLAFVGPRSATMRRMGDKAEARRTMASLGLHGIPGSEVVTDVGAACREGERVGWPVLLKAVAGGGGRGMRRVASPADMPAAFEAAGAEAAGSFGDGRLYLERLVNRGRHVEFQVLGDGRCALCLGARECSVQRRHQKLLEETPSPALSDSESRAMGERVAAACAALRYRGAGTVEMLRDRDGHLWFMEVNARLQVEHTVTEAVTGLDLVEQQLRVAANGDVPEAPPPRGHAIECRINAEDPERDFRPAPGTVTRLRVPVGEGIRVDTHLTEGDAVPPHYDSMIAKVVAWGEHRALAIDRMRGALEAFEIEGVPTTIAVHRKVLTSPEFEGGDYDTTLLEHLS